MFYGWLTDHPDYEDYGWYEQPASFEPTAGNGGRRLTEEDYLSETDIEALCQAATHPREEALIQFLADTAARINLVCNLRRQDVDLGEPYPTYRPNPNAEDGYKGAAQRRYPIHYAEQELRVWLNSHHPDPADGVHPDAPLFPVKIGYDASNRQHQALHLQSTLDQLKTCAKRADIDPDRVHPHAFRHAAVRRMRMDPNFDFNWEVVKPRTQWSNTAFEQMKELYGKLTEGDELDEFYGHTDRVVEEAAAPDVFTTCQSCGRDIAMDAEYCRFCGRDQTDDMTGESDETAAATDALRRFLGLEGEAVQQRAVTQAFGDTVTDDALADVVAELGDGDTEDA